MDRKPLDRLDNDRRTALDRLDKDRYTACFLIVAIALEIERLMLERSDGLGFVTMMCLLYFY